MSHAAVRGEDSRNFPSRLLLFSWAGLYQWGFFLSLLTTVQRSCSPWRCLLAEKKARYVTSSGGNEYPMKMMWLARMVVARRSRWISSMNDGGRGLNELCIRAWV